MQNNLTTIQEAVPAGIPLSVMEQQGLLRQTWQLLTHTWLKAAQQGGHHQRHRGARGQRAAGH